MPANSFQCVFKLPFVPLDAPKYAHANTQINESIVEGVGKWCLLSSWGRAGLNYTRASVQGCESTSQAQGFIFSSTKEQKAFLFFPKRIPLVGILASLLPGKIKMHTNAHKNQ